MQMTSPTSIRTSGSILSNVDEAERVKDHVLHSLERTILSLHSISGMQLTEAVRVRMIEPGQLLKRARRDRWRL